jgi:hypothetical protein
MKQFMIPLLLLAAMPLHAQQPTRAVEADRSKILFLTFEMEKTGDGGKEIRCTLKKRQLVNGNLGEAMDVGVLTPVAVNVLYYQITHTDGTKGAMVSMLNPLQISYEYPAGGNRMERTTVNSLKGECTIRLQWQPRYQSISLYQQPIADAADASSPSKMIYNAKL